MQVSFDRCNREKMSLAAELEVAQSQLDAVDVDYSKVSAEAEFSLPDSPHVESWGTRVLPRRMFPILHCHRQLLVIPTHFE